MSLDWSQVEALPAYVRAAMQALRLDQPDFSGLEALSDEEWKSLLDWLDRQQMTLLFGHVCAGVLPGQVAARIAGNLEANRLRRQRLLRDYAAIAKALDAAGVSHAVLKGFSHGPPYVPEPELRPQYDLDLLVSPEHIGRARDALESLGFESAKERDRAPADHIPPMIRRTGWQWKGDYFDPDIPPVVELHHRLWDPATEGFDLPSLSARDFEPSGNPAYAAAHALRHLLRGSLKTLHLYELARWVQSDPEFGWSGIHAGQAAVLGLAERWFSCSLPAEAAHLLPEPVKSWLKLYGASPLTREFRPNKDELWLHLELADGWWAGLRVARRRLAPMRPPGALEGQFEREPPSLGERALRGGRYAHHVSRRAAFHVASLGRMAGEAVRWSRMRRSGWAS